METLVTEQTIIHNPSEFGGPSKTDPPAQTAELDMSVPAVLNRAADIIQSEGWYQGWYCYDGKFCSVGAIRQAAGLRYAPEPDFNAQWQVTREAWADDEAWLRAADACDALESYLDGTYVPIWNDNPDRTPTEVVEAMRSCALIEDSKLRHPSSQPTDA